MAVHIRLARYGTKKAPFYRIVVTDQRNARDGRFIENLGTFDPRTEKGGFVCDGQRLDYWVSQGALPSATIQKLLKAQAPKA